MSILASVTAHFAPGPQSKLSRAFELLKQSASAMPLNAASSIPPKGWSEETSSDMQILHIVASAVAIVTHSMTSERSLWRNNHQPAVPMQLTAEMRGNYCSGRYWSQSDISDLVGSRVYAALELTRRAIHGSQACPHSPSEKPDFSKCVVIKVAAGLWLRLSPITRASLPQPHAVPSTAKDVTRLCQTSNEFLID